MPRVNPYRPQYDFNDQPTASGALLFVGIVAAVILGAIVWAAYTPQTNPQPGAMNSPATTQSAPTAPTQPRTPTTTPAR
jgi:hypothetical protein